jgi:hypothetical protein
MKRILTRLLAGLAVLVAGALCGCGKSPPPVTEVEGTILLDKQPLPFVMVEFMPDLTKFGAEVNSSATTDEKGFFRLTYSLTQQPGAVVGKHRVVISDIPTPEEYRSQDPETQAKYARYRAGLKNRPIPKAYTAAGKTDLIVEVTADKKTYNLELTRGGR